jgi:hypothetical protein
MKKIYLLLFVIAPYVIHSQNITATIGYQGYEETQEYYGEGEYEIFLDNIDGILDHPIIITDGFDPGDNRDITDLYNSLDFDGDNLADILRDEGFDAVALNFPQYTTDGYFIDGGADYIQRNAMVLIELITLINAQKVGNQPLVIVGPSMGGLIARYALAYMEENGLEHDTRLYISVDSPHLGANIPVSLQYLINYLAVEQGIFEAQLAVDQVLNSPAAKEMLMDHYLGHLLPGSDFEQDPTMLLPVGAPGFRDAFQSELDDLGFPELVRNVTMINGSGQSMTTGTPGMQVVDTTLDLGGLITADIKLHFTPEAGQTNMVTEFESFFIGIPFDYFSADAESFPFTDGVDSAPGGMSSISDSFDGSGDPVIQAFIDALDQDEFSFIPTISALAIENEDDWFVSPDIGGIHNSPFVNTFIPAENEFHGTITVGNANFALDEIRNGVLSVDGIDLMNNRYRLMENPITNRIHLKLDPSQDYQNSNISIFSITGQQVYSNVFNRQDEILINTNLNTGIYILNIVDQIGTYSMKIIAE